MSNNQTNINTGIGFFSALTLIFITLKLTKLITWSWWWVLSPIWMQIVIIGIVLMSIFIFILLKEAWKWI